MPYTFAVPNEYGYVLLAGLSTFVMGQVHGANTVKYRKLASVPYPAPYASNEQAAKDQNAYLLNCAQRAHANYTENQLALVAPLLVAGIKWPVASAVLGGWWTFSRYLYMTGYCSISAGEKGKGRYRGMGQYISVLGLWGMTVYLAVEMIRGY